MPGTALADGGPDPLYYVPISTGDLPAPDAGQWQYSSPGPVRTPTADQPGPSPYCWDRARPWTSEKWISTLFTVPVPGNYYSVTSLAWELPSADAARAAAARWNADLASCAERYSPARPVGKFGDEYIVDFKKASTVDGADVYSFNWGHTMYSPPPGAAYDQIVLLARGKYVSFVRSHYFCTGKCAPRAPIAFDKVVAGMNRGLIRAGG
ncbi:hypothetical protein GCM10009754_27600 [Amycolatopsis minnesotensis]|uniref:PknH-like extracellular domain-containing protein n=1 Tax=Amycolatopsis minnesotensis TaxID=337894 RepID=A0ABP5C3U8_9PSEU